MTDNHHNNLNNSQTSTNVQPSTPAPKAKRFRGLVLLAYALTLLVVLFVILLAILFYTASTQRGTQFLLDKISAQTGAQMQYVQGNLKDGVWLSDVHLKINDKIDVYTSKAYIQIGWRAIFGRQVHLVNPQIDVLRIHNKQAPTGEPFEFFDLKTPVDLRLDKPKIQEIRFTRTDAEPFSLRNISADVVRWQGTKVTTKATNLSYEDLVDIKNTTGFIDFQGEWPLQADAQVHVKSLDDVYFGEFNLQAGGTLKRSVGQITSTYNKAPIQGEFIVQSLDDGVPFSAKLGFDKVVLPYADSQRITLSKGQINADGVISEIELRVDAQLSAKDIPSGRYQGRGTVHKDGMQVDTLSAQTAAGRLDASATMRWSDAFEIQTTLSGDGYKIRQALPKEFRDYQAYLPATLKGDLDFRYYVRDKQGDERYEFELRQNDGERFFANIAQNPKQSNAPWRIDAHWSNLHRLELPDIGELRSKQGRAEVLLYDNEVHIDAQADILKLNAAPAGDYLVKAKIKNNQQITLDDFQYQGTIGQLQGKGQIQLATAAEPLSWQLQLNTHKLMPNAYFPTPNKTPFELITGRVMASGRMRQDKNRQLHEIVLGDADLTAHLAADKKNERVHLAGRGRSELLLVGGEISHFKAQFDGQADQSYLSQLGKSQISADIEGDLNHLKLNKVGISGASGTVVAKGDVKLNQGITWNMSAKLDQVNTAKFVQDSRLNTVMTGDLLSSGHYHSGKLQRVDAKLTADVMNQNLPKGQLNMDISGAGERFTIHRLAHQGEAGELQATGWLDISKGIEWQAQAQMQDFNVGGFVQGISSHLNGGFQTQGSWKTHRQLLRIDALDIKGKLNNQPFKASGDLSVDVSLPKDISGYINQIKQATHRPKSKEELLALRQRIDSNARQTQNIIHSLKADNLQVAIGDNLLNINGADKQLTANVQIKDFSQIYDKARGTVKGGVIVMNDDNALPTLYVDIAVAQLRAPNVVIQNASAIGKIVNLGNSDSQMLVQGDNIIVFGKVIKAMRADFSGTEREHLISVSSKGADVEASATVKGGLDRKTMQYQGVLSDAKAKGLFGSIMQRQPTEFRYGLNDSRVELAAHCWQSGGVTQAGKGVICLQDSMLISKDKGHVDLVIQNLDTQVFSAVLPSDIHWQSTLNGRAKVQWQKNQKPLVDAVIYSDNGRIGLTQDDTGYVQMPYKRSSIIAKSVDKGLKIRTDIEGVAGKGYADITIDPYAKDKPISGALAMNELNLAVLRPFFPNIQALSGKVDVAGGLGGTLKKPLFYGNAQLQNGSLIIAGVPLALQNINVSSQIRGTNAQLEGEFEAGKGKAQLTGQVDWQQELQAQFGLRGDNLEINKPPLVVSQISPDLEVIIRPNKKYVDVQGVVLVPSAVIRPPEAEATIVGESEDVSVLDRRITGNVDQILAVVEPWNINADIGVDLGKNIEFRGFGARLPLVGALHLTQSGKGVLQAKGVIQLAKRTQIDGIGQNLELNYAQIRFNGDMLNPRLSIEGEKQIEGQIIGLRIRGTAATPQITVFNDAGLSEQQAMNALFTGRLTETSSSELTEQGFRTQVTNQLAAAGLSLGLSGTRNLTNQLGQALGLQSLTIDASGNSTDTNVNITGYITPDLYIRYGVGVFNAESSLSMRYQLTRRVYVEATSATERLVDVIYRWKF